MCLGENHLVMSSRVIGPLLQHYCIFCCFLSKNWSSSCLYDTDSIAEHHHGGWLKQEIHCVKRQTDRQTERWWEGRTYSCSQRNFITTVTGSTAYTGVYSNAGWALALTWCLIAVQSGSTFLGGPCWGWNDDLLVFSGCEEAAQTDPAVLCYEQTSNTSSAGEWWPLSPQLQQLQWSVCLSVGLMLNLLS